MLVEPPLMQPYRFLDYWWREGDNMIMQPKKWYPNSNSFRFIIYILQEGGGCRWAIPDAAMLFFRLLVEGGW